ncbi:MAG: type II secretion system protein E [Bdellovibrionales bacterium CG12_big_fil_rev_8_21_14_0_65_38_15]|nr:MAG: type II secretion system protein E [Bdellovibrionales bacterium CG22_combo_CG10-13_8_21_14_all_38_13]PIQ52338.1 MAG: type II secretion system protein E [Bdellovibrionales bacterium CG12_big_fil_rev_8_21_14_0_65_38_15]PIR30423.1 MAG: type II secretion system protein E [Bdellovibrionales bacterium CG11_big_fil_rev_8_21_14_0_20_38_13]
MEIFRTTEQFQNQKIQLKHILRELIQCKKLDEVTARSLAKILALSKIHPLLALTEGKAGEILFQNGLTSIDKLTEWYAKRIGVEYIKVDPIKVKVESVVGVVPYAYASRLQIMPIHVDDKKAIFVTSEPFYLNWVHELESTIKKDIEVKFASPTQIKILLEEIFVVQKVLKDLNKDNVGSKDKNYQTLLKNGQIEELDSLLDKTKQKNWGRDDNAVIKIVDWIMNYALNERASDIHLEPKKGMAQIRFRVDGKLRTVYRMDPAALLGVTTRIKILANIKIDEKRKPQDGRIKRYLEDDRRIELRVSTIPTPNGEKIVMRIFDQTVNRDSLDIVDFSKEDHDKWLRLINSKQGLIIVTGPTGSGKTTTLYSSLNILATDEVNVCTIEDPIEIFMDSFNQVQVKQEVNLTFANAIRTFLRQDPDVIMVGEIRDHETGDATIQASLTGHLVFSTLHTNGALASIQRLIDLGLPTFLINSSLKAIMAQRLVRKLCPHCKTKVDTPREKWQVLKDDLDTEMPKSIYTACGCNECKQTGYIGRICIYELVEFTDEMKLAIHDNISLNELKSKTKGMFTPFRSNCLDKIKQGLTSIEEVLEIIF